VSGTSLREARASDAGAIARLHVQAWQWAYAGIMPGSLLASLEPAPREAMWAQVLETPEARARTALAVAPGPGGEELAGFAAWSRYRPDGHGDGTDLGDDVGEVRALYLARAYQGRGIGRALMARAVDGLAAAGFSRAALWVLEENGLARHFYERQGWAPDGARAVEVFGGMPLSELRYGRSLP